MTVEPFDLTPFETLARDVERRIDEGTSEALLGAELTSLAARIPSEEQVTPGAVVRLALITDLLTLCERVVFDDDVVTPSELGYLEPLAREAQKYLARFRHVYRDGFESDLQGLVLHHRDDRQKFGGRCKSTAWTGLAICKRAAALFGDARILEDYRDLTARMVHDLFDQHGSGAPEAKQRILAELAALLPSSSAADPRDAAYCAPTSHEVFHAVAHAGQVFELDPFDVKAIHAPAREAYARLLDRAGDAKFGRMLLLKGDAGTGKTHLMRSFRNQAHGEQAGFAAYLQMSAASTNYARYILSNVIDSWDRPFWGEQTFDSAVMCLSDSVTRDVPDAMRAPLRDEGADAEIDRLVNRATDALLEGGKYGDVHMDVLRMMLYLQRREPARRSRILKYLRCEPLSPQDREYVGGVSSFEGEEGPARMLEQLGRLVAATGNGAFVLLVDQLEDLHNLDDPAMRFRLVMDALRYVTDHVPTSVVVIACLEDLYLELRGALAAPMRERLERDPEPVALTAARTLPEIEELVALRLQYLFDQQGLRVPDDDRVYPFRRPQLAAQSNGRARDVLDWCRMHHEASIRAGHVVDPGVARPGATAPPPADVGDLSRHWNEHHAAAKPPPDDERSRVELLGWALGRLDRELDTPRGIQAKADESYVDVTLGSARLTAGLCDKAARGGHLGAQVDALARRASERNAVAVVLRSSEYPPPGTTRIAQALKTILQAGGRKLVVTDGEWRTLHAVRTFEVANAGRANLEAWVKATRPLSGVDALRSILALDEAASVPPPPPAPPPEATTLPPPSRKADAARAKTSAAAFEVGHTRGLTPQPVTLDPASLTTHAAFLGSSGSGKTTLALRIVEQLALEGVPIVMVDRKGDLCTYASDGFWKQAAEGDAAARKAELRERLDVRVYTPGEPRGRPLRLPVVPTGLAEMPPHERAMTARHAASALGAMMGYRRSSKADETRLGILGKAIALVGSLPDAAGAIDAGIGSLVAVLHDEAPELLAEVGKLNTKHFHALVENLETLRLRYEHVLRAEGDLLSPELLFGGQGGRTRLSIVSTKFLGDNAAIDFWVARLLGELGRWASRSPSARLQGALLLDEADIYLPATSKPATKEPMLDLLKRARSAGLAVLIATQSPGDLDYRCRDNIRTWFVGRVAERTAIEKMKPLLSECRVSIEGKLANAKVGEFFRIYDGEVVELKALPSIMKTRQLPEDEILRVAR